MKKRTLGEIKKELNDVFHDEKIVDEIKAIHIPQKFLFFHEYLKDGESLIDYYCESCGKTETISNKTATYKFGRRSYSLVCPSCGNGHSVMKNNGAVITTGKTYRYVVQNENGFDLINYKETYLQEGDTLETMRTTLNVYPCLLISYRKEEFFHIFDGANIIKKGSREYTHQIDIIEATCPINMTKTSFSEMINKAIESQKELMEKEQTKKVNSKSTLLETMKENYKAKEISPETIMNKTAFLLSNLYSTENERIFKCYCTKCGTESLIKEEDGAITCPVCGNTNADSHYSHFNNIEEFDVAVFENTNLPENDLLIRVFRANVSFKLDEGFRSTAMEIQRIFAGKKLCVYNRSRDDWKKGTVHDINYHLLSKNSYYRSAKTSQSDSDLAEIIHKSCLNYSGLLESWGLGDSRYQSYSSAPDLSYLLAWYRNNAIELLLKSNLTKLLSYYISDATATRNLKKGKTPSDVLGVDNNIIRMAAKLDLNERDFKSLCWLHKEDPNLTIELFQEIRNNCTDTDALCELKRVFGIDYAKSLKYLQTVYDYQCIEKAEAMGIWKDYLRMAKELKIDLKDKNRLFPTSLKKEHDVAVFAYQSIKKEVDKKQFEEQANINKRYNYSYKDLFAVVPTSPEEVVEEATRQKNCLRSYVERIKNGETVIVFIRKKDSPDDSYVTAEVRNGRLTQLEGSMNNRNPHNRELNEFLEHWKKAKNIK